MNPSENQNPQTPSQPGSTPESVQSFAPQAIFSHPPVPLEQIQLQEQQEEKALKKKQLIKKLAIIIPSSVLIIGVLAALILTNVIPLQKFKTITYENEKGQQFKLKFYPKYTIGKISYSNKTSTDSKSSNMQFLISKKGVDGKSPLAVSISEFNIDPSTKISTGNEECSSTIKKFSYYNAATATTANVCSISPQEGKNVFYLSTFHKDTKGYIIFVLQNLDWDMALSDNQNARKVLNSADLSVYDKDLETILSSIQPL
jgi:hypothetical protein